MDLKDIVQEDEKITGWATFKPGFDVELEYVSRMAMEAIRKRCRRTVWKGHQPVEETNEKRLATEIARFVNNWRGLTREVLESLFPIKEGVELNGLSIPCTEQNKLYVLEKAYGFDEFVIANITELQNLKRNQLESELKNSDALSQEK